MYHKLKTKKKWVAKIAQASHPCADADVKQGVAKMGRYERWKERRRQTAAGRAEFDSYAVRVLGVKARREATRSAKLQARESPIDQEDIQMRHRARSMGDFELRARLLLASESDGEWSETFSRASLTRHEDLPLSDLKRALAQSAADTTEEMFRMAQESTSPVSQDNRNPPISIEQIFASLMHIENEVGHN